MKKIHPQLKVNSKVIKVEEYQSESTTNIEDTIRPLLTLMKIFGLYHVSGRGKEILPFLEKSSHEKINITNSRLSGLRIYCKFVAVLLVLSFLKTVPAFWIGTDFVPGIPSIRIMALGFCLLGAMNTIIMFIASNKRDNLRAFFHYYNKITTDETSRELRLFRNCQMLQRRVKICTGLALSVVIICQSVLIVMIFSNIHVHYSIVLTSPFPNSICIKILASIYCVFCVGGWVFPLCFVYLLSSVLIDDLKALNVRLEDRIKENDSALKFINDVRIKHHQYTTAIKMLDVDVGKLLMSYFSTGICMCCFILYELINNSDLHTLSIVIFIFWFAFAFTIAAIASVKAAILNSEAHAALDNIYNVDPSHSTPQEIASINMFLSKLNGPAIGFTTMYILTITKELLLTLLGVFATYFFLLLQFKI